MRACEAKEAAQNICIRVDTQQICNQLCMALREPWDIITHAYNGALIERTRAIRDASRNRCNINKADHTVALSDSYKKLLRTLRYMPRGTSENTFRRQYSDRTPSRHELGSGYLFPQKFCVRSVSHPHKSSCTSLPTGGAGA